MKNSKFCFVAISAVAMVVSLTMSGAAMAKTSISVKECGDLKHNISVKAYNSNDHDTVVSMGSNVTCETTKCYIVFKSGSKSVSRTTDASALYVDVASNYSITVKDYDFCGE